LVGFDPMALHDRSLIELVILAHTAAANAAGSTVDRDICPFLKFNLSIKSTHFLAT
jgi:hypothetical protein